MAQSRESEECVCYSEGCQRPCSAPATDPDLISPLHPHNTPRKGKTELRAEPFLQFSPAEAAAFALGQLVYIAYCGCNTLAYFTSSCADCTMNARKHCNHKPDGPIYPTRDNVSHVNMRGLAFLVETPRFRNLVRSQRLTVPSDSGRCGPGQSLHFKSGLSLVRSHRADLDS